MPDWKVFLETTTIGTPSRLHTSKEPLLYRRYI